MHILEKYALSCGVKIDKPCIYENFYPLDFEKYITLQTCHPQTAKAYDYYDEVIDLIFPYLKENGIKILQLGDKQCKKLAKTHSAFDASDQQNYYIISKSLLHFGDHNVGSQFASSLNKNIVFLNSISYEQNVKPFWSKNDKCKVIEPDRLIKPSFSLVENQKQINKIKPERVAQAILDLLGANENINFKTHRIGQEYSNKNVNVIPNCVAQVNAPFIVSRLDVEYDQENLLKQLKISKAHIVTKEVIHPDILTSFKDNILSITYNIQSENQPKFIEFLRKQNIKFQLATELDGEEYDDLKLPYLDYGIIAKINKPTKQDFNLPDVNNLKYLSSKAFISNNKIYPSLAAVEADLPTQSFFQFDPQPVIDNEKFWNQAESFYFLTND